MPIDSSEPQAGGNGGSPQVELASPSYPPAPALPAGGGQPTIKPAAEHQAAQAPLNTWGHNTRLSERDIKRAVLEHVQQLARQAGQQVPADLVRFLDNADVIFLDEHNQPVRFKRVVVTWEDV